MSAWAYYTMRANASSQGLEASLDTNRQPWSHQLSQSHLHSQPSPYHHRQQSEDENQNACGGWGYLNLDSWRTGWLARAIETVQIKWWHHRTDTIGGLDFEREAEENEYRREERLIATVEARPYRYDS